MVSDVYMIFLTALALFGMYKIVEEFAVRYFLCNCAETMVLVLYSEGADVCATVNYLHNIFDESQIIVVAEKQISCPLVQTMTTEELLRFITNDLFTKN